MHISLYAEGLTRQSVQLFSESVKSTSLQSCVIDALAVLPNQHKSRLDKSSSKYACSNRQASVRNRCCLVPQSSDRTQEIVGYKLSGRQAFVGSADGIPRRHIVSCLPGLHRLSRQPTELTTSLICYL